MKKTVLKFGFLSGGAAALMMSATVPFIDKIGFENGAVVGYTAIVISFLFVFFGIKSYRDNVLGGRIGFGRAFGAGLLITLISCVCYVVTWEVIYFNFMPNFVDEYNGYVMAQLQASGAPAAEIEKAATQGAEFKRLYANPFFNFAMTFMEPFPVGLLVTTVSAVVLRRKKTQ